MKKLLLTLLLMPFLLLGCKKGNNSSVTSSEQYINVPVEELTLMEDDTYQIETEIIKEGTIVFYSSMDEEVAAVSDSGLITAIKEGTTNIVVRGGKDTFNIYLEVLPFQAKDSLQIVLTKDSFTLAVGDDYVLPLQVKIGNEVINNAELSFDISDTAVASINGLTITALNAGTTKCVATARYAQEEVSKGFNITVY